MPLASIEDIKSRIGTDIGSSPWIEIGQASIDTFADVTGDRQFIHVDPAAAAQTPFGGCVAHGFLTLSLLVHFWNQVVPGAANQPTINYGVNRVRFPAPVPAGSRIRGRFRIEAVDEVAGGGRQATIAATVEREGGERPVCVAELLLRFP